MICGQYTDDILMMYGEYTDDILIVDIASSYHVLLVLLVVK